MRSRLTVGRSPEPLFARGFTKRPGALSTFDMASMFVSALIIGVAVSPVMLSIGTSYAVVMAAAGLAWSGTGEVAFASVILAGGGAIPALGAALLVSSRFGLLAMSLRDRWPASILERIGMYHYASEVAVANAIDRQQRFGSATAQLVFWQFVIPMATGWVLGSALGLFLVGAVAVDPEAIGLDVAFPASFVGSVLGGLYSRDSAVAVLGGGLAALALTPVLPAGLPILVAAGMAVVALAVRPGPLRPTASAAPEEATTADPVGGAAAGAAKADAGEES